MNPVCHNNEALCTPWENNALVVKQGIEYLRTIPGITKVILLGGSGGGPTMSFYQAVAEKRRCLLSANSKINQMLRSTCRPASSRWGSISRCTPWQWR